MATCGSLYSANRNGNYRHLRQADQPRRLPSNGKPQLGPEQKLTRPESGNLQPGACTDQTAAMLWLACQSGTATDEPEHRHAVSAAVEWQVETGIAATFGDTARLLASRHRGRARRRGRASPSIVYHDGDYDIARALRGRRNSQAGTSARRRAHPAVRGPPLDLLRRQGPALDRLRGRPGAVGQGLRRARRRRRQPALLRPLGPRRLPGRTAS